MKKCLFGREERRVMMVSKLPDLVKEDLRKNDIFVTDGVFSLLELYEFHRTSQLELL